jgi:superfamily II DNA or RNA helicase
LDGQIVICSYQFARNKAADVQHTTWDVVVMDEAHRLRNVYKPSNVIANTLRRHALLGKLTVMAKEQEARLRAS